MIQIVDARNPLFFYASDLDQYIQDVSEGKKEFMLLINKSDFLSPELIAHWNAYFTERKIKHLFFSALQEQDILDSSEVEAAEQEDEPEQSVTLEQLKTEDVMQDTAKDTIFTREFIEKDAIDQIEQQKKR